MSICGVTFPSFQVRIFSRFFVYVPVCVFECVRRGCSYDYRHRRGGLLTLVLCRSPTLLRPLGDTKDGGGIWMVFRYSPLPAGERSVLGMVMGVLGNVEPAVVCFSAS